MDGWMDGWMDWMDGLDGLTEIIKYNMIDMTEIEIRYNKMQ